MSGNYRYRRGGGGKEAGKAKDFKPEVNICAAEGCGRFAPFGFGPPMTDERVGLCGEHRAHSRFGVDRSFELLNEANDE